MPARPETFCVFGAPDTPRKTRGAGRLESADRRRSTPKASGSTLHCCGAPNHNGHWRDRSPIGNVDGRHRIRRSPSKRLRRTAKNGFASPFYREAKITPEYGNGARKSNAALQRCKSVARRPCSNHANSLFRITVLPLPFFGMPFATKCTLMPPGCIAYAPVKSRTP
jgi:hypothetical protein